MFSLNDSMRYMLYNQPADMRKSFNTLSGLVKNAMGHDPYSGDVYIFMNKSRNRLKLLHWEPGGLVLYSKVLDAGTFNRPTKVSDGSSTCVEWRDLVLIVEGVGFLSPSTTYTLKGLQTRTVHLNRTTWR